MSKNRDYKKEYNNYGTKRGEDEYDRYEKEKRDVNALIKSIQTICDIAGFRVENRIELKNKETGKRWS